jgi:hypothetical protein
MRALLCIIIAAALQGASSQGDGTTRDNSPFQDKNLFVSDVELRLYPPAPDAQRMHARQQGSAAELREVQTAWLLVNDSTQEGATNDSALQSSLATELHRAFPNLRIVEPTVMVDVVISLTVWRAAHGEAADRIESLATVFRLEPEGLTRLRLLYRFSGKYCSRSEIVRSFVKALQAEARKS